MPTDDERRRAAQPPRRDQRPLTCVACGPFQRIASSVRSSAGSAARRETPHVVAHAAHDRHRVGRRRPASPSDVRSRSEPKKSFAAFIASVTPSVSASSHSPADERAARRRVGVDVEHAQRRPARRRRGARRAPGPARPGRLVPRVGVLELPGLEVQHARERRDEKRFRVLAADLVLRAREDAAHGSLARVSAALFRMRLDRRHEERRPAGPCPRRRPRRRRSAASSSMKQS